MEVTVRLFAMLRAMDESYVGGKAVNMHPPKRARKITATGYKDKSIVLRAVAGGA